MSTYNINRNDLNFDIRLVYELYRDFKVRLLEEQSKICERLGIDPDDDYLVKALRKDIIQLDEDIELLKECGL